MEAPGFADRLSEAVTRKQSVLVVGLDPRLSQLPAEVSAGVDSNRPGEVAAAFARFCRDVIDAVADLVPAVKPQAAFFEQWGPSGMVALRDVIAHATQRGLLVILDAKRGDIGSTATAYAEGMLGAGDLSAWGADALTVNPYLGDDSLDPFVQVARQRQAGLFVLVKTSNPGGALFQDIEGPDGAPLYARVGKLVEELAQGALGNCGYGDVGAVVGATYPEQLAELRAALPHCWFLVPGFGAQGGSAADIAPAFDDRGLGAVVNSSRGIIFAHRRAEFEGAASGHGWQRAVELAARQAREQLAEHAALAR